MKSITHMQLFIHSLTKPKMLAAYRLVSVGKIIQYTFLMIFLLTAFSSGSFIKEGTSSITGYDEIAAYAENLEWLIYVLSIAILYVMNTIIIYAKISLYAFVLLLFAKAFNRRAEYRHLWRTVALAITWEVLLTIILPLIFDDSVLPTIVCIVITMTFSLIALTKYPKMKK